MVLKLSTASVEQASSKSAPLLLLGDLTPSVLHDWRESCEAYCYNIKDLKPEDYVKKIAYGMRDPHLCDWYRAKRTAINVMSLEEYIKEMSARFLRPGWEDDHHDTLLLVTQGDNTFWDWANHIQSENTTLLDTHRHLSDDDIRKHLNTHMHPETKLLCKDEKANQVTKFEDWLEKVCVLDERCQAEECRLLRVLQRSRFANKPLSHTATSSTISHTPSRSTSSAPTKRPILPKLTDDEKALLNKYHGCYKCRRFNANHTSSSCPNGFPNTKTYKTLMEADAMCGPRPTAGPKPTAVAAIIGDVPEDIIAAIVMPSAVLDDEEPDTDECVPLSLRLLHFPCTIGGPAIEAPIPITAMLDHGSGMMLISESLTQRLGLWRFRLPTPRCVHLAMDSEGASDSCISLSECVKISVSSLDQCWRSRVVRAVVMPGLCCDLLCGLTFQSWNHLVIDAEKPSAVDQTCGYDLLNPMPASRSVPRTHAPQANVRSNVDMTAERVKPFDVISAVRDRIDTLTLHEQLSALDAEFKTTFADLFPDDIPHVTRLPTNVYHRIRLKDPNKLIAGRQYSCPKKYRDAWHTLLHQHFDAG
ncbi:hypothetical protein OE88DRAFT_1626721 [Heliocybe sulcata]|uniref:Uncharacterized protein n=1 Tax=Heliocybe sulcata TaxID=5364 RepID=A0A5C3N7H7_9AGAM|nr:hypothetical protein OE88DRAFT_1626721 [Heliocybe sulcata]